MIKNAICGYKEKGMWWFRIFGYGLSYKDTRIHHEIFSERFHIKKNVKLGPFIISFLPKYVRRFPR